MNKNGFVASLSAAMALIVSILFIFSIQPLILNKANVNKKVENFTQEKVNSRNGLERLYSFYNEDISSELKAIEFKDLNISYKLEQVDEAKIRNIRQSVLDQKQFRINNKTDLIISFSGTPINLYEESYVDVVMYTKKANNNSEYFEENGNYRINLNDSKLISSITKDNYGDYKLIYSTINVASQGIDINVEYTEQSYREINIIENEKVKRTLVIDNNVIDKKLNTYLKL